MGLYRGAGRAGLDVREAELTALALLKAEEGDGAVAEQVAVNKVWASWKSSRWAAVNR